MHSNTSTASILYGYTPSKSSPPSSPSTMKRTKSNLTTLIFDGSPKEYNDNWCHIEETVVCEDDCVMMFPMDE